MIEYLIEKTRSNNLSVGLCQNHHILTFIPTKDTLLKELDIEKYLTPQFFEEYPCKKFSFHYYIPGSVETSFSVTNPELPWTLRKIDGIRHIKTTVNRFTPNELEKTIPNSDGLVAPLLHNRLLVLVFENIISQAFRMDPWIMTIPGLQVYLNGSKYEPEKEGYFLPDGDRVYYYTECEGTTITIGFPDRKVEIQGHTGVVIAAKDKLGEDDPDLLIKRIFTLAQDKLIDQDTLVEDTGVFTKNKDHLPTKLAATLMGVGLKETNPMTYILDPIVPKGFGYKASNHLRITTDNLAPLATPQMVQIKGYIRVPRDTGFFIYTVDQIEIGGLDLPYIYGENNPDRHIPLIVDGKETQVRTPFLLLKKCELSKQIKDLFINQDLIKAIHQNCDIFKRTLADKDHLGLDYLMATMILLRETSGYYPWSNKQVKKLADWAAQSSDVHVERLERMVDKNAYINSDVAKLIREAIAKLKDDRQKLLEVLNENSKD